MAARRAVLPAHPREQPGHVVGRGRIEEHLGEEAATRKERAEAIELELGGVVCVGDAVRLHVVAPTHAIHAGARAEDAADAAAATAGRAHVVTDLVGDSVAEEVFGGDVLVRDLHVDESFGRFVPDRHAVVMIGKHSRMLRAGHGSLPQHPICRRPAVRRIKVLCVRLVVTEC